MKDITWEHGRYSILRGMVDGLELFTISASTSGTGRYYLRSELPGFGLAAEVKDVEEGKQVAAEVLASFIKRLT